MSTRIVGTHVVAIAVLLGSVAAGQVFSVLPAAPPGPTELDRAYHYSTIGQELAYAKASQSDSGSPAAGGGRSSLSAASGAWRCQFLIAGVLPRCLGPLSVAVTADEPVGGRRVPTIGCRARRPMSCSPQDGGRSLSDNL
jgi:hypothetical protein